jgi:hypothetical protein
MVAELLFLLQRSINAMETMYVVAIVSALIALCIASFFIVRMSLAFYRLRGQHEVLCPDNGKPATVEIRVLRGAMTSVLDDPEVFVRTCSRWPEKAGCDEGCVRLGLLLHHE